MQVKGHLQDNELELSDVIRMHPVLGCLTNETTLASSSSTVAFHGVAPCSYDIIQLRKLHDIRVVVVLEERLGLQSSRENRLEHPSGLFLPHELAPSSCLPGLQTHVVLLDNLLEPSVVQLDELGQVVNVCDDIAEVLLQHHELLFSWSIITRARSNRTS